VSANDTPQSQAELDRWNATIKTMETADRAAGITDPGTVAARDAHTAAANGRAS
jgi:hypothetical protein